MECATAMVARAAPRRPRRRAYCAARYVPVVRPAALAASVRLVRRHFDQLRFRPASLLAR